MSLPTYLERGLRAESGRHRSVLRRVLKSTGKSRDGKVRKRADKERAPYQQICRSTHGLQEKGEVTIFCIFLLYGMFVFVMFFCCIFLYYFMLNFLVLYFLVMHLFTLFASIVF